MKNLILMTMILGLASCTKKTVNVYPGVGPDGTNSPGSTSSTGPVIPNSPIPSVQGVRTGSGGDGIACYTDKGELDRVYLWDVYEAMTKGAKDLDLGDPSKTPSENLEIYFQRIFDAFKDTLFLDVFYQIKYYSSIALENKKAFGSSPYELISFINSNKNLPQTELIDVKDDASTIQIIDENCKRVQIARSGTSDLDNAPITIDSIYYNKLPNHHKALLIIHEIFLTMYNLSTTNHESGEMESLSTSEKFETNTSGLRSFIRLFASDKISKIDRETLLSSLQDFGFIVQSNINNPVLSEISDNQVLRELRPSFLLDDHIDYHWNYSNKSISRITFPLIYLETPIHVGYFKYFLERGSYESTQFAASRVTLEGNQQIGFTSSKNLNLKFKNNIEVNLLPSSYITAVNMDGLLSDNYSSYNGFLIDNFCGDVLYDNEELSVNCIDNDLDVSINGQDLTFARGSTLTFGKMNSSDQVYISKGVLKGTYKNSQVNGEIIKTSDTGCAQISISEDGYLLVTNEQAEEKCSITIKHTDYLEKLYN